MKQISENVWQVCAGVFPANSYLWTGPVPGGAIVVDTGLDPEPILAGLKALDVRPAAIFCTHGHFDHIGSASVLQNAFGSDVYLHAADAKTAKVANFLMMAFKIPAKLKLPRFSLLHDEVGQTQIGEVSIRHRLVPGHSPGSCLIEIDGTCFSGDTLYSGGLGLSKIPGEEPDVLRSSLRKVWDTFDPETLVCPGHGRAAIFAAIREHNTELVEFMATRNEGMAV
ncbi:MBL fold metallo-hydrolase [Methylobacterium sp. J-059]|uniref:MBL fold metallo-hydrolase n=1 Tax=Methylobacterium sp. J-059 TaxID=2836643 RepID=UPI001FBA3982|nr:MBL fold metallo-hydrolase [Methylobacterium sp. J-059]MCJ2042697.1 MBL fold metallo-hydrolase [Methylobacterium sp. J-059]